MENADAAAAHRARADAQLDLARPGSADGISRTTMRSSASSTAAFIQVPCPFFPVSLVRE